MGGWVGVSVIIASALVLWDRNWDQSKRIVKDNDQDQDLSLTSICSQTNGWQTLVVVVKLFLLVGYTILIEIFFFWLGGWAKNFFVPIKPCLGGHTSRTFWSKSWFGWFPGLIRPKRTAILPYVVWPPLQKKVGFLMPSKVFWAQKSFFGPPKTQKIDFLKKTSILWFDQTLEVVPTMALVTRVPSDPG